jgi:hypothetical protein
MDLHRPVAHAGSSAPLDLAGSPARRGWPRWQMKALMERQGRATMGYCRRRQTDVALIYDSRRRLHWCTDARNTPQKLPLLPFFGTFGAASRRDGSLSKLLQHYEIRHDLCPAGPSKNRVGIGAPKLPHRFPLIVHYLRWVTMAPDPHSWALRASPDSTASSRMSVRRSHCYLTILLFEPCERLVLVRWQGTPNGVFYGAVGRPAIASSGSLGVAPARSQADPRHRSRRECRMNRLIPLDRERPPMEPAP